MSRITTATLLLVAALTLALLSACETRKAPEPVTTVDLFDEAPIYEATEDTSLSFLLRLREGDSARPRGETPRHVEGTQLNEAAAQSLLDRLPAVDWSTQPSPAPNFEFAATQTPKPTRSKRGAPLAMAVEPDVAASDLLEPPVTPFRLLQHSDKDVKKLVKGLHFHFSEAVVDSMTVGRALESGRPVRLEPQPPGVWRWKDPRTLVFEPEGTHLPNSTRYVVEIPAESRSLAGTPLEEAVSWSFETAPLKLSRVFPSNGLFLDDKVQVLAFDQPIDHARVMENLRVSHGEHDEHPCTTAAHEVREVAPQEKARCDLDYNPKKDVAITRATTARILEDDDALEFVRRLTPGTWLAFHASEELPPSTDLNLEITADALSAEGPLESKAVSRRLRTLDPLSLDDSYICRKDKDGTCELAGMVVELYFKHPIDKDRFESDMVRFSPEVPNVRSIIYNDSIYLMGEFAAETAYEAMLSEDITDIYGQRLIKTDNLQFETGPLPEVVDRPQYFARSLQWDTQPVNDLAVLSARGPKVMRVRHSGYKRLFVQLYRVEPKDWSSFREFMAFKDGRDRRYRPQIEIVRGARTVRRQPPPRYLPGTLVYSKELELDGETANFELDLTLGLAGKKTGHLVAVVTAGKPEVEGRTRYQRPGLYAWAQVTDLAVDAIFDSEKVVVLASDIKTGEPLKDVGFALWPDRSVQLRTGEEGAATLRSSDPGTTDSETTLIVARRGADVAFVAPAYNRPTFGSRPGSGVRTAWYVVDDRKTYRPGEPVRVKGWIRQIGAGPAGAARVIKPGSDVHYEILDPRGNTLKQGKITANKWGAFDLAFDLPEEMPLGQAHIAFTLDRSTFRQHQSRGDRARQLASSPHRARGGLHLHDIKVAEFRRPEFEAHVEIAPGPHFVGEPVHAVAQASYFSGGELRGSAVHWSARSKEASFTPPGRSEFSFGKSVAPWSRPSRRLVGLPRSSARLKGQLGHDGRHRVELDSEELGAQGPHVVTLEARVEDVNRQSISASSEVLIHSADLYVGVRAARNLVKSGAPFDVDAIVSTVDGDLVADKTVSFELTRPGWNDVDEPTAHRCEARSLASGPVRCSLRPTQWGWHDLTVRVIDDQGRVNESSRRVRVSGGSAPSNLESAGEENNVELVPDRSRYSPGDRAELFVQSPFYPAHGLLSIRRKGLMHVEQFHMSGPTHVLGLGIEEAYGPNIHVEVRLSRLDGAAHGDPQAVAQIELPVSLDSRELAVTLTPEPAITRPGASGRVKIEVRNHHGQVVPEAELAVWIVDEAILSLSGYTLDHPHRLFSPTAEAGTMSAHLRGYVFRDSAEETPQDGRYEELLQELDVINQTRSERTASRPGSRSSSGTPGADKPLVYADIPPIAIRQNFAALAAFEPSLVTDGDGRAELEFDLPESATRYRVLAVAAHGDDRFGTAEAAITAQLPLTVRPSPPRFLTAGDTFSFPVVLQNQTEVDQTLDVAIRARNLEFVKGRGRRVTVPANDRIEVRFDAQAPGPGEVDFDVVAAIGHMTDAATGGFTVHPRLAQEAVALDGVLTDSAVAHALKLPEGVDPASGGLEISVASTRLGTLTDGFIYLANYRHACTEQLSSRVLATASLFDVLASVRAHSLPPRAELEDALAGAIKVLRERQRSDGAFALWRKGGPVYPFASIHATYALLQAREAGFEVPQAMIETSARYLRSLIPAGVVVEGRQPLVSEQIYAMFVLHTLGHDTSDRARALLDDHELKAMPAETLAWLMIILEEDRTYTDTLLRELESRIVVHEGRASFNLAARDGRLETFHSPRRADAVFLQALLAVRPDHAMILPTVDGLLAARQNGHWRNTQQNAFSLVALKAYFDVFERATSTTRLAVWLGESHVGELAPTSKDPSPSFFLPMRQLLEKDGRDLTLAIASDGVLPAGMAVAGGLPYRAALVFGIPPEQTEPLNRGFGVTRRYEAIDDPDDVRELDDGRLYIRAGARVRVHLTVATSTRRTHVFLVDPMPAGLEALDPEFSTVAYMPDGKPLLRRHWYEHADLRDHQVEVFASRLAAGTHTYSYFARATTPGEFLARPTHVEEMYDPMVLGRSDVRVVQVW